MKAREAVAANLVRLRKRFNMSQQQLADALRDAEILDWTASTIADLERQKRHLRADEALALSLFLREPLEDLLAPGTGRVSLGTRIEVSREEIWEFLSAACRHVKPDQATTDVESAASRLVPKGRGINSYRGSRAHLPITRRIERELEEWERLGGDRAELIAEHKRVAREEITPHQYAAWKRHALARLRKARESRSRS